MTKRGCFLGTTSQIVDIFNHMHMRRTQKQDAPRLIKRWTDLLPKTFAQKYVRMISNYYLVYSWKLLFENRILVHTYSDPKDPGSIVESMYSDFIIKNLWKTTMKLYCVHFVNKTPLLSLFCCFDAWSAGQTIGRVYRLDSKTLATLKLWNIWFLPGWS